MQDEVAIKHLLLLTPGFPDGEADTTCLPAVQQFVKSYKHIYPNVKITILTLHYPFKSRSYKWYGIQVYSLRGKNKHGLNRGLTILRTVRKALKINREDSIDAMLCLWLTDAALSAKYVSVITGIPYLVWLYGQDARAGNKYVKLVNPAPSQLATMSAYHHDVLKNEHGIDAAYIVHNGLNTEIFAPLNESIRSIDLLAVGSLIPLKRYHLFIALVKEISITQPGIQAVLAGEGILETELRELVKTYGIEKNITITGALDHAKILNLMNDAKAFIHTSEYEGHSTVMLEALYAGCKVFSFIPAADHEVEGFTLCQNMQDMQHSVVKILQQQQSYSSVLVHDMKDSAIKIHSILTLLSK